MSLYANGWMGRLLLMVLACSLPGSRVAAQGVTPSNTGFTTGSAFCVAEQGMFITAYHVIKGRDAIALRHHATDKLLDARLIKVDPDLDLALLQVPGTCQPLVVADWATVPVGLDVYVLGYPSPVVLGPTLKITTGLISGYRRATEPLFQLSAAVQKGNSGGPVISPDGLLVGVVQRKLDALKMAERNGDLVQNVSFAVNAAALCRFLISGDVRCTGQAFNAEVRKMSHVIYAQGQASTWMVMARERVRTNLKNQ